MIQEVKSILKDYSFALGSGTILTILVALLYKYSKGEKQEVIVKEKIIEPKIVEAVGPKRIVKNESSK